MPGRVALCRLLAWTLVLLSAVASAQEPDRLTMSLAPVGEKPMMSPLPELRLTTESTAPPVDYATFVYELLAFLGKEILSDSREEYPESPIGSRLSPSMPEQRSAFGSHCLTVIARLGSAMSYDFGFAAGSDLPVDSLSRVATAALMLRRVWSAFDNHARDNRRAVSLRPKVGTNKVRISLTFHW